MTKPISRKLTLEQAIKATSKPIKRYGDLVIVQKDGRFGNLYGEITDLAGNPFPVEEMRNIFMPSIDGRIVDFKQPQTENFLHELYRDDGYLESLEHFSDEALAMYFEYRAGFVTKSGLAGDAGDPSQYESDVREALSRRAEITPDIVREIQQDIVVQHKKYKLDANKGRKFTEGRRAGAKAETTKYIAKLNEQYPTLSAKELYKIAIAEADSEDSPFSNEDDVLWDKSKDDYFDSRKFEKRLSEIRNPK